MNTDFSVLPVLQPGLNPWLVVLLSSIAGLLAFALSNALYVLHTRHGRLAARLTSPSAMRVRNDVAAACGAVALAALALSIPGPKLVEGRGWLSGDNLFSVTSRAGFIASYPNADRAVRKGDSILQLVRDAGPEEIASAANRRAQLAQDLEFARLEVLQVDPLLLATQAAEKGQLDGLLERRRGLVENQQSLLRGAKRDKLGDQSKLDEVERDLQAARHELDQTESSYKIAAASFENANRPEVKYLLSNDEIGKREERAAVLRSRREELRERIALLTKEQTRMRTLASSSDETHTEHMQMGDTDLEEIDREIALARERVQAAWQAIEQDKVRAERQREYRLKQIELQIAEHDQLLQAHQGALEVRAPWDGLVGFREPSPASARLSNRPLLVLYKPGSISVRIHVSADEARLGSARGVGIDMEALIPEAASATFAGKIARGVRLADGAGELQIAADPPEAAIRELATGSSVPVHVVIRRLNPLAAVGMSWAWWLAGALVAGCLFSEARLWWVRRHVRGNSGADAGHGPRVDWGGNPDEFLEFVVGVGIVSRNLRRGGPSAEEADERRMRREQAQRMRREHAAIGASNKSQSALPK